MTEPARIEFPLALDERHEPTVGIWNRLEGRPRTADFAAALRAEIRDPLWLLTRQWQLGEFRASDAGSPVTATYSVAAAPPTRYRPPAGPVEPLPDGRPLESVAERRSLAFRFGPDPVSFDLRLTMGHRWLKMIRDLQLAAVEDFRGQYVARYPVALPDPEDPADTPRAAHPQVWATLQAAAGRQMDGYLLYRHLKDGSGHQASDGIVNVLHLHYAELNALGREFTAWFDALIDQPAAAPAWDPARLEHRFSVAAATPDGEQVLTAPEYPGGELDWHAFSVDHREPLGGTPPAPAPVHRTVFPTPVRFSGMPLPRWWAVEDGRTNFAAVRPDSTDLARLIFLEFALVYSNDWYQLPCDLPSGTLASVRGLCVTDVFGMKQWINPAATATGDPRRRWSMFTLDPVEVPAGPGGEPVPPAVESPRYLLLPPGAPAVADGPVLEEVLLVRDEQANLVWGLEQTVRTATGEPRRGSEMSAESTAHRRSLQDPPAPGTPPRAAVAYRAMNSVPEHWIPFIAVHTGEDRRSVRLQRAAMPHAVDRTSVRPRTELLREGLDVLPPARPRSYYVNEEEVPQGGSRLTVAFNRTRGEDGRVTVWLSARRGAGRGEVSSGLAFDHLVPTLKPAASDGTMDR
ncbi:hypothetical protein DEJ50_31935 [Streptomyces venezuelae]|uniref:Uncharacterized protein n=1 Tax=Streptomyces venezuelae TaxID=54571 RepID=A0A5P2D9D8_STRVZ|nr:hypothetical protein [Streptomyces venezuelae]QES51782.1 hypothetical protein DEJ50_31935 [Streptomyces venezuelae]